MRRRLTACVVLTVLSVVLEPILGVRGHWPVGTSGAVGVGGSLLLALGPKVLGRAWLQEPDAAGMDGDGA
jgi:hypothetical protein